MEKNEVITLEDRGFIHVNGAEAKDFLEYSHQRYRKSN